MITEHILNPYPRRLWIATNENFDNLKSEFKFPYKEDADLTHQELIGTFNAVVFKASKNDYLGYLVFITDAVTERTLVHESIHVTFYIYEDCYISIRNGMDQEPFCYLAEYIYSLLEDELSKTT